MGEGQVGRRRVVAAATVATALLSFSALTAQASVTPVFHNNNATEFPSLLVGDHDVDATAVSPPDVISNMPATGTLPSTATLLTPWPSPGTTITSGTGSSRAKGGAGHTQGSNLAKITFPSGMGLDQTDPNHVLGGSRFKETFQYVWDLSNPGTLGPPMSGTFSVPVGVKVGTGPGAYAKFEYDIHWDARVNNIAVPDVRAPFTGSQTFTGAGTYVTSFTAPSSAFSPTSIVGGNANNLVVMRGYIAFEANNDDSRSLIEILGSTLKDVDDTLRQDSVFLSLWNDPSHPEFRTDAYSGFEEDLSVPEPSCAIVAAAGAAGLLLRRRRPRQSDVG
jgi:hypothetical protein